MSVCLFVYVCMCVLVYVCVCVCVCVCVHIYIHTYIFLHMHMYTHTHTHTQSTCVCVCACVCVCVCVASLVLSRILNGIWHRCHPVELNIALHGIQVLKMRENVGCGPPDGTSYADAEPCIDLGVFSQKCVREGGHTHTRAV